MRPLFRRIVDFARSRYETDKATYHVSATLASAPPAVGRFPTSPSWSGSTSSAGPRSRWAEGSHAPGRQILHCTFGSTLTDPELGPAIKDLLQHVDASTYDHEILADHFARHPGRPPVAGL